MYIAKQLGLNHKEAIYQHLILLEQKDRYNRFCGHISDHAIRSYVESINYKEDGLFGVFNQQLELVGFSHIAISNNQYHSTTRAEFAFSVLAKEQGHGLGNILMRKAVLFSKAKGIKEIQMNCLSSNQKSQHLAKKHGLKVELAQYGEKTAILETNHPKIEQLIAQNQSLMEDNVAGIDLIRQININYLSFLNGLYADSIIQIFDKSHTKKNKI